MAAATATPTRPVPPLVTARVFKKTKGDHVGLAIGLNDEGRPVVSHLAQNGLFAQHTSLQKGMEIVYINGQDIDHPTKASAVLKDAEGSVLVVAKPFAGLKDYDWSKHQDEKDAATSAIQDWPTDARKAPPGLNRASFFFPQYADSHLQQSCCAML